MFYIPIYNSILEGCWTNLLKFWRNLLNLVDDKDLIRQNKLNSLVELVNKRGLSKITTDIDVDIRNAINHGGVHIVDENTAIFQYNKGSQGMQTKEKDINKFKRQIYNLVDIASSTFLGILKFLNKMEYDFPLLSSYTGKGVVYDSLVKLNISTYNKTCNYIYKSQTIKDQTQLNISYYTDEMSLEEKLEFSIFNFMKLHLYYPEIERFYIKFTSREHFHHLL
ncbi:hypothetical protein [Guptibacillus spartinae]|uniref:hypothetical protein n=1 Tax=Guptibacillus spartinae TaxID=3025679 RepID=UPI002361C9FC|nr:hypothetical protein [Pseudalkalibacillus spartinae]